MLFTFPNQYNLSWNDVESEGHKIGLFTIKRTFYHSRSQNYNLKLKFVAEMTIESRRITNKLFPTLNFKYKLTTECKNENISVICD